MSKLTPYFAPAGSVVARLLPDGGDELFLPFFSTHFMLPVKVGEVIWVLYPDETTASVSAVPSEMEGVSVDSQTLQGGRSQIGSLIDSARKQRPESSLFQRAVIVKVILSHSYLKKETGQSNKLTISNGTYPNRGGFWITRITGTRLSEDLNFTHIDRDLDNRAMCTLEGKEPSEVLGPGPDGKPQKYFPSFPNGIQASLSADSLADNDYLGEENNSFTFSDTSDAYDKIQQGGNMFREPVPPSYKTNEGEFVINGSNNTRISMSTLSRGSGAALKDATPGSNLSKGIISLTVGHGLEGQGRLSPVNAAGAKPLYEQEKCPELRDDIEISEEDPHYSQWQKSIKGENSPQARFSIMTSGDPNSHYINNGASLKSTFPFTVPSAGIDFRPKNVHQTNPTDMMDVDPVIFDVPYDNRGSVISGQADHIRFGSRESLRIGVDGGAEIILHRDGNIFLKPGPNGQVYLGGGPDELGSGNPLSDVDDTGMATYCDLVTYPNGVPEAGPPTGLVAEHAIINKLPAGGSATGRRFSPKVKVKT